MEEENKVSKVNDTINAVTGLVQAVPIYEDAIQPVAKQLGKSLETVGKLVNVALAPISILIWGYDKIEDFIQEKVPQKLVNVAEEDIITPNPHIAAPLIEALRYTGNNEELREMFANLLANSMNKNTASKAHPAYVDIIKNMTSDEAKTIKYFSERQSIASIEITTYIIKNQFRSIARNIVNIDNSEEYDDYNLISSYIDNLCRLGLLEVPSDRHFIDSERYKLIEEDPNILKVKSKLESDGKTKVEFKRKIIQLTDFGNQFIEICVDNKE